MSYKKDLKLLEHANTRLKAAFKREPALHQSAVLVKAYKNASNLIQIVGAQIPKKHSLEFLNSFRWASKWLSKDPNQKDQPLCTMFSELYNQCLHIHNEYQNNPNAHEQGITLKPEQKAQYFPLPKLRYDRPD